MKNIFKKAFLFFITFFTLFSVFVTPADAQEGLLFGQTHNYSVTFRGNGEAVVYAKIVITNSDEDLLDEISFEIPSVTPSELVMYQMELPEECIRYNYGSGSRYCLEYRDPDYTRSYWYYGYDQGEAEYSKLEYSKSGQLYNVELAEAVAPYNTTAIVVAYAAKGYVKNILGVYKYDFETFKVPSRIQDISVSISVDSELYLKGKKSEVNYSTDGVGMSDLMVESSAGFSNRNLDKVVRGIGSGGQIVKEAENLSPNESFSVRGEYAKSWVRLYLKTIFTVIFIIAVIFVAVYYLSKYLKKRKKESDKKDDKGTKKTKVENSERNSVSFFSVLHVGVGFLSVLMTIGLTFLIMFLASSGFISEWLFYSYRPILSILSAVVIVLFYFLTVFGPAIFLAIKKGWKSFLAVIVMSALWAIFLMIAFAVFFEVFDLPSYYPYWY